MGALVLGLTFGGVCVALVVTSKRPRENGCGLGFTQVEETAGARCVPNARCPTPLAERDGACLPPETRVHIPAAHLEYAVVDWEAEGKYPPASVDVKSFAIDAFEASVASFHCATCAFPDVAVMSARARSGDLARAKGGVSLDDAKTYCGFRKGRLPTEFEWIRAATARENGPSMLSRYPWGDTGAVCRRAAWGFLPPVSASAGKSEQEGACGGVVSGADTVGAHLDGSTTLGVHDLAGNVAEWVIGNDGNAVVKGGSYVSNVASELRYWWRARVDPNAREPWVGVRCVYDDA